MEIDTLPGSPTPGVPKARSAKPPLPLEMPFQPNPLPENQWLPKGARSLLGLRVGIYTRISDDRNELGEGVGRQHADSTRHAWVRGADATVDYEENDTSAYTKKRVIKTTSDGTKFVVYRVVRPVWERMLQDLRSGKIDAVVVYDTDRLARDNRDLEDAIELVEYFGKRFEGVTGSLELVTDAGRAMARVLVAMANKQSADTGRRVKRVHQQRAEDGEPMGGTRPFGWQEDKRTLLPAEAEEIRAAVKKINAGVKPYSIMADWNRRGVLTSLGNVWRWTPFMMMLRNPRICGYRGRTVRTTRSNGSRSYHWEIVTRPDGTEVKGQFEGIVPRAEWDALIEKIGTGSTAKEDYDIEGSAKYMLTGLVRCGKCMHLPKMTGCKAKNKGTWGLETPDGNFWYTCASRAQGGCGRNTRSGPAVDALIRDLAFGIHDTHTAKAVVQVELDIDLEGIDERLSEIETEMQEVWGLWKEKKIKTERYAAMVDALDREKDELTAERSRATETAVTNEVIEDVRANWNQRTAAERRAFIQRYISMVIIHPIEDVWDEKKGRMVHPTRFNPDLIEPVYF